MAGYDEGTAAFDFSLTAAFPGGGEKNVRLGELAGKWVVIFMYPKDSTSG
jgi:peroxiredoxin